MNPTLRKWSLTAHVAFSVSWMGAVASFLVLAIAGLASTDADLVRAAYRSMDLIGRYAIVPFCLVALASGLIEALGTPWGLIKHYWVASKFLLTAVSALVLLLHQFTAVAEAARISAAPGVLPLAELRRIGMQLVGDAGLAIAVLLAVTSLSIVKPWGRTPYGRRELQAPAPSAPLPLSFKLALTAIGTILLGMVLQHVMGGGMAHHGH